jgi:hypothetical protein
MNSRYGLVVRVPDYRKVQGFDSRHYQIFWEVVCLERGPFSLVSTTEELLGKNSSGSGLEIREYYCKDPLHWTRDTFYQQKMTLTSATSGGTLVGIVRSRTKATEFSLVFSNWLVNPIHFLLIIVQNVNLIWFCMSCYLNSFVLKYKWHYYYVTHEKCSFVNSPNNLIRIPKSNVTVRFTLNYFQIIVCLIMLFMLVPAPLVYIYTHTHTHTHARTHAHTHTHAHIIKQFEIRI